MELGTLGDGNDGDFIGLEHDLCILFSSSQLFVSKSTQMLSLVTQLRVIQLVYIAFEFFFSVSPFSAGRLS